MKGWEALERKMTVWVDDKTGLPTRFQLVPVKPRKDAFGTTDVDEIVWDPLLDPNIFKLEVPKRYTVYDYTVKRPAQPVSPAKKP